MADKILTQARVHELFDYDPLTGVLTWRHRAGMKGSWNARHAGKPAGYNRTDPSRYRVVGVDGRLFYAHRIIWCYVRGIWPEEIDHVDHDGWNNRWVNLREVDHRENHRNKPLRADNTSGHNGVRWHQPTDKWQATITDEGRQLSLGYYATKTEAIHTRKLFEKLLGFHENHGRGAATPRKG